MNGTTSRDYLRPAVLFVLIAGVALRFVALGQQSFWFDEVHSVAIAQGAAEGTLTRTVTNIHGPLYLLLLRGWMALFGTSEAAARALSALLASIGLVLFYRAGLKLLGRTAALLALALLAASPFYLWYSQETRNYALLFDLGIVAVLAFLWEMDRRSARSFVLALLATVGACLSNLSGFFLFPLYVIYSLLSRKGGRYPLRRLVFLCALSAILLWPWIHGATRSTGELHLGRPNESIGKPAVKGESPPGLLSIPYTFYNFSLGVTMGPSVDELKMERMSALKPHLWYLLPAAVLFGGLAVFGAFRVKKESRALVLLWVAVPVLSMAALSMLNLKAPNSRYALIALPPYMLLLSAGICSIKPKIVRGLLLAAILGLMLVSDYQYFTDKRYWRPDARSAGRLVLKEAEPGDAVVVYALEVALLHYLRGGIDVLTPPTSAFHDKGTMEAWLRENTAGADRVWIVQCMAWWVDREDRFLEVARRMMDPVGEWHFNKAPVYLFEKPVGAGSTGTP